MKFDSLDIILNCLFIEFWCTKETNTKQLVYSLIDVKRVSPSQRQPLQLELRFGLVEFGSDVYSTEPLSPFPISYSQEAYTVKPFNNRWQSQPQPASQPALLPPLLLPLHASLRFHDFCLDSHQDVVSFLTNGGLFVHCSQYGDWGRLSIQITFRC